MKKPSWQITEEKYYAQKLDDKYGMSYELYVQQMADEGKIVLPFGKEPYKMNRKEFYKYVDAGYHPEIGKRNPKEMLQDVDKYGRREAERRWTIEHALAMGKSVPIKILQDYPDLMFAKEEIIMPKIKEPKPKPLPPDVIKPTDIMVNSTVATCYGKQTKRGFRVYCRKKEEPEPPTTIETVKFPYPPGPLPHLPEYLGVLPNKAEVIVSKTEIENAIRRARQHAPGEWQAEILEIALIPQMWQYLKKQNPHYELRRVKNGYVLHPWNPPERPHVSTAYDGFRRNFYDAPLHGLRSLIWSPEQSLNIGAVDEWLSQDKIGFRNK